jgi:hypothetical protein
MHLLTELVMEEKIKQMMLRGHIVTMGKYDGLPEVTYVGKDGVTYSFARETQEEAVDAAYKSLVG